jgi:hypothetical protein
MAKRSSINARAKKAEREVQQYLWPGSRFAGNAHRPALEDEDLRGPGLDCSYWWGECKSYTQDTLKARGGPWQVLANALDQCVEAVGRAALDGTLNGILPPRSFAVLRVPNTSIESPQNLVIVDALDWPGWPDVDDTLCLIPLSVFKAGFIGEQREEVA